MSRTKVDSARHFVPQRRSMIIGLIAGLAVLSSTLRLPAQEGGLLPFDLKSSAETESEIPSTPAHSAAGASLTPRQLYDQSVASVVWIIDPHPAEGLTYTGTGFVIDVQRRLIVTNQHVVERADGTVELYFPEFRDGELVTDAATYLQEVSTIRATVLDTDINCDLALLQADSLPDGTMAVQLATESARPADRVHTIGGNPHGSDAAFVYCSGSARGVANGGIASGGYCRKLETDMDINFGNSGGAIFNDQGHVVAVCEGIRSDADGVNMCVDVKAVREYLDAILSLLPADTSEKLHQFGKRHHREGRYEIAIKCYSHAIRMDNSVSQIYSDRALSYYATDELTEALSDVNRAIELDGANADAYENRGLIQKELGYLDEAIDDLRKAVRLNPKNAWTSHYLAGIFYERGDYTDCINAEAEALRIDATVADFHQRRADAYQELGQYQQALEDLELALQLDNADPYTFFLVGYSYFHLGEFEVSLRAFARGADLEPSDPASYWTWMGDSARMLKKPEMAVEAYSRAIQLDAQSPFAFWGRGLVFQQAGLNAEAQSDFAQAETLLPGITDLAPRGSQTGKPSTNESLMPGDLALED